MDFSIMYHHPMQAIQEADSRKKAGGSEWAVSRMDLLACALPLGLIAALLATYFIDRDFYLTYVLEPVRREYQAVEITTLLFLFLSVPLLASAARRQWRSVRESGGKSGGKSGGRAALVVIVLVLLAAAFALGEEADWGDTFFNWTREGGALGDVPALEDGRALNLHNNLPIRGIGSAFVVAVFFGLPVLWAGRERWKLPAGLRPAVAEWPVVFAMGVAFGWRLVKHVYIAVAGKGEPGDSSFYGGFVEQTNEHKEMLIAVAFFLYALYRLRATRARARSVSTGGGGQT